VRRQREARGYDNFLRQKVEAAARLSEHSLLGKAGRIPGTRGLFPHESYRMVYELGGEIVWILTLVHAARQWPAVRGG